MIASPRRISPSSTVGESRCPWYGRNAFGTSLISSGHPVMIVSAHIVIVKSFYGENVFISLLRVGRSVDSGEIKFQYSQ